MEKMKDIIYRQDAIDAVSHSIEFCNKALDSITLGGRDRYAVEVERNSLLKLKDDIKLLLSAQPEQRLKGKWVWKLDDGDPDRSMMLVCSICGSGRVKIGEYNFCPTCGAKMINARGEQDG